MAPAVTPTSSAHSHPIPAKGVKRPRKGTAQPSTSILAPPSGSVSSVGPKDIVNGKQRQQAQEDEGNVYSATPPTKPTKKLSTGAAAERRSRKDSSSSLTGRLKEEELDGLGSSSSSSNGAGGSGSKGPSAGRTAAQPVKSALAASARLLSGPPGGSVAPGVSAPMASDRYKRSMYTAFVDNAFLERDRSSTKSYWDLVSQFRSSALSPSNPSGTHSLSLWLLALSHHVSKLDMASHSQLVENILDLPWAGTTDEFCKSWCRFVCALVSARTEWAANVLNRIVKALRWRSDWLPLQPPNQTAPSADAATSSQPPTQPTRRLLYTRTHLLLRAVLALIPTSVSTLNQLLVKHFPHRREGKREQATFARNILFITQYEGQVAETVWRVVADRAIGLDVEIQIELDELEEEGGGEGSDIGEEKSSAASDLDPFDRAIDDDDSSEGSDSGDEGGTGFDDLSDEDIEDVDGAGAAGLLQDGEEERKDRKVRELVDKLDALMKVCLEHLEKMGTVKGKKTGASELVLDPRSAWLNDFLGTAAPSSGNVTPTSERPQSFSVKTEELTRTSPEVDEEFEATKDALFHHLLQLFSRSILPTFKCRHVQFLLFWYCSLETDFADYFLGFLIHKAIYARSGVGGFDDDSMDRSSGQRERAEPLVLRQASASYVASFVSRAHYITPTYTRTVVLNLCSYLEAHLEAYSNAITLANSIGLVNIADERTRRLAVAPPGSEEHAIWYAVAQAVFYIFCFRWQDLKIGGAGPGVASTSTGAGPGGAASSSTPRKVPKAASITSSNERDADEYEVDGGLMIGSLSSTGSSSYAMPSSVHRGQHFSLASHKADADAKAREAPGLGPSSFSSSLSSAQDPALGEIQLDVPSNIDTEPTGIPAGSAGGSGTGAGTSSWSQGLSILQRAILSPLNPLQHCSGTVVRQFAAVAQHVGFLYCWSLIEANNRRSAGIGVSTDSQAGHGGASAATSRSGASGVPPTPHNATGGTAGAAGTRAFLAKDLEGFFPFDPYRLSSTAERFVAPLYREWRDVAPVGLGGDEEEEEEEGSDEESDDEEESTSGGEEEEEESDSLTSESQEHHNHLALSASRTGLQIPGSGKRPHHHRRRQRSGRGRGAEDSSLLSASDASRNEDEEESQGDGAGIGEGLEAMSVSAS